MMLCGSAWFDCNLAAAEAISLFEDDPKEHLISTAENRVPGPCGPATDSLSASVDTVPGRERILEKGGDGAPPCHAGMFAPPPTR